ncbi:HNH endonuclease [Afifella marina]|uniref:HNH domain-containing protein n=1 Tax=Afifella marina DSM 2698 TaxID=1120955 RepID=A0A1G5NJ48_AFIMA|nr:HNH endonuclease [Afifella marina]MBK1623497.1 HNH endonuclease [Afifella marina DSM 2698]MBK1626490.1 HNH endonuclease [Afifella marina]MBK5916039.1 hypothetical protein [Afifella marina]RAI18356.1 hypothetical protein CH311_15575 [Afifella marina DSM 2698]SCZ36791.1 hypothetical protein SAMN03080610_02038 [Afifella marina DSM 2698]
MKFRRPLTITSRTSTVTNSFVQAVIPSVVPTPEEMDEALAVLGINGDDIRCAYCGDPATDWDHLRPLVCGKKPSGYITEIRNLVPACGPCNQSKSGQEWRAWIESGAKNSPKTRGVPGLEERIRRLARFEEWGDVRPLDLRALAGEDEWDAYWGNREVIVASMQEAQRHAERIKAGIRASFDPSVAERMRFAVPEPGADDAG